MARNAPKRNLQRKTRHRSHPRRRYVGRSHHSPFPQPLSLSLSLSHPTTNPHQGYSQFKTHRRHMAQIGDWRNNPALEIPLDGVGGVSLLVRADLHRKGDLLAPLLPSPPPTHALTAQCNQASTSPTNPSTTRSKPRAWPNSPASRVTASSACRITSSGTSTRRRKRGTCMRRLRGLCPFWSLLEAPLRFSLWLGIDGGSCIGCRCSGGWIWPGRVKFGSIDSDGGLEGIVSAGVFSSRGFGVLFWGILISFA